MTKAKIFVAYTGGTIGMKKTRNGYEPVPGYLEEKMSELPPFAADDVPAYTIHEFKPLLDSSNMTPQNWLQIAEVIRRNYDAYDGFLALHGTDTMAYTASALSFMLENLAKPIVVTGSQIPLAETRNDAQENLLTALMVLGTDPQRLTGVYLHFDNLLLRGNRTTKVNADGFAAFASPNLPPVGKVGINIEIDWSRVLPPAEAMGPLRVKKIGEEFITVLKLFPGIRAEAVRNLLAHPVKGVVLEAYGAGNGPSDNHELMAELKAATGRGVVIVAVTQPLIGSADLNLYATGNALREAGVVSGYDMTTEAAVAKLFYLFAEGHSAPRVRELVQKDLRGELTPPPATPDALQRSRAALAFFAGQAPTAG